VSNITLLTSQYLYIQLQLWNVSQEKINNMTYLPRTALNIDGKTYNVCSVICHHGESLYRGNYTTMISV